MILWGSLRFPIMKKKLVVYQYTLFSLPRDEVILLAYGSYDTDTQCFLIDISDIRNNFLIQNSALKIPDDQFIRINIGDPNDNIAYRLVSDVCDRLQLYFKSEEKLSDPRYPNLRNIDRYYISQTTKEKLDFCIELASYVGGIPDMKERLVESFGFQVRGE